MRSTKLLTALVAVLTAAVLALTTVSAHAAKPPHRIKSFSVVIKDYDTHVFVVGADAITAKGERIYLQTSKWGSTRYRTVKSQLSSRSTGHFHFRARSGCGYKWRIVIRADKQQRTTTQFHYWPDRPRQVKYFGHFYC